MQKFNPNNKPNIRIGDKILKGDKIFYATGGTTKLGNPKKRNISPMPSISETRKIVKKVAKTPYIDHEIYNEKKKEKADKVRNTKKTNKEFEKKPARKNKKENSHLKKIPTKKKVEKEEEKEEEENLILPTKPKKSANLISKKKKKNIPKHPQILKKKEKEEAPQRN